jgi:hypothetical protein
MATIVAARFDGSAKKPRIFERRKNMWGVSVMPALVAGIHALTTNAERRRGWPGQARP